MTLRIRSILAVSIIAIVLAACSTAGSPASPSEPAAPTQPASPSADPSAEPKPEREVDGTITVAEGMTPSGPGATIQEALDSAPSDDVPTLVNGVLFRDVDGKIYLATSVSDEAAPTFDGPMLEVLGLDNTGDGWDMDNADVLGLQEANGIVFNPNAQVLGFLEIG